MRLLDRTTRSVAPTDAGRRLLDEIEPSIETIRRSLEMVTAAREQIAGTIRISSADHAAETLLWPVLRRLRSEHRGLSFEVHVDNGLVDIVSSGFDAGIRLGDNVPKDMVAAPIGGDERTVVVCSPSYLSGWKAPATIEDLGAHDRIVRTLPTLGGVSTWPMQRNGRIVNARVTGALTFNRPELVIEAALAGCGLANVLESQVGRHIASGQLVELLADWSVPLPGYRIYYPKSHQPTPAFKLVLSALRYRGEIRP